MLQKITERTKAVLVGELDNFRDECEKLIRQAQSSSSNGGGGDVSSLVGILEELKAQTEQNDVTKVLLRYAINWSSRAILFALKGKRVFGWQGIGLQGNGDESIQSLKHISFDLEGSLMDAIARSQKRQSGSVERNDQFGQIVDVLGDSWPSSYVAVPITFQGRVVAVFYSDDAGDGGRSFDPHRLTLVGECASLAMENIGLKRGRSSKSKGNQRKSQQPSSKAQPQRAQNRPSATTTQGQTATADSSDPDLGGPDLSQLDPDTRKKHEKAQRKARVIVRDIMAYNQDKIERGRQTGNLAELLADDIKKGKDHYRKQVDPEVANQTDYFTATLVELVANGDRSVLGL